MAIATLNNKNAATAEMNRDWCPPISYATVMMPEEINVLR
jgi:hypothetical protein